MKPHPRASASVIAMIKGFEGLRRKAARLPDGGWTLGYGHTRSAREGAEVDEADAEALLTYDLLKAAEALDAWCFSPLNQNQADALLAFAFNIGLEAFQTSNVLRLVNEGDYLQAASALELWRKAEFGGEVYVFDALVRRRAAEKALFLTPVEGFRPAPSPVLRPSYDPSIVEIAEQKRAGPPVTAVASLEGDRAELELDQPVEAFPAAEPELSPAQQAAANLAERLNRLFADDPANRPAPPPRPEDAQPEDAPLQDALAEDVLPEDAAPEPEAEPPFGDPFATAFDELPPPPVTADSFKESPADVGSNLFTGPYGRRLREVEQAESGPVEAYGAGVLALALLGAAMVAGSLIAMLGGRATLTNLAIGLAGVICLAPAAARFITARLERGER